jgi:flagellar motor switch protein FliN/FliY
MPQQPSPFQQHDPVAVRQAAFQPLAAPAGMEHISGLDLIMDVPLRVTVELGRTRMQIRDVLDLGKGSVVELDKLVGEPVDMLVNGKLIAKGEVVVIDENFGIRVTDIVSPIERFNSLKIQ